MKAFLPLVVLALLSACTTTPPIHYHSLLSTSTDARPREAIGLPPLPVDLAPVRVPGAVDQPQWVVRMPDDTLRMLEGEQWVSPLRDELGAALFERLAQRYAAVDARTLPGQPAVRVRVDVQRFESIAGKEVWLDSVWSAHGEADKAPRLMCRSSVREPAGGDLKALADAHRRAVVRLADEIGAQLLALANGAGVRCP
ncbi:MAG TPA: PqiC family protein [Rhizobacter sp.]|nr:PqiC family protein [Rhizobacter sp.]